MVRRDYYNQVVPFGKLYLASKYNQSVKGIENIPDEPAIYAINHLRFDDSLLVAGAYWSQTGKPLRFGGKSGYFEGTGIDDKGKFGRITKWLVENTKQIPIYRDEPERAFVILNREATRLLEDGDSLALHPEGSRSRDGRLNKFKSGIARIAIANHVPVVPVGVTYAETANYRRTRADITFGKPTMPADFPSRILSPARRAERLTETLEEKVAALTGQERSYEYARRKQTDGMLE